MSSIVHINQRQQRIDAAKLNRSEAINRTLVDANRTITHLRAELFAARVMAGTACATVVILVAVMARHVVGGV